MAKDLLIAPPIRQSVEDVHSAQAADLPQPLTEKSWYLYWQRLGEEINQLKQTGGGGGSGDVQHSKSTGEIVLVTSEVPIPGTELILNRSGRYLITGNFMFRIMGDSGWGMRGDLLAGGDGQGGDVVITAFSDYEYIAASQQWIYTAPSPNTQVLLRAWKDGGAGTSSTVSPSTSITALWISA